MFLLDKRQLWDLKLENLEVNFGQFKKNKGITAASGNFDDHLDLLEFLCINVMTSQKTTYNIPNVRMFGMAEV